MARKKGHKTASGSTDPAFMLRGFCNWKKAGERFLDHQNSLVHKNYEKVMQLDASNIDIEEQIHDQLPTEKAENPQMLLTILCNVQYLGRQGLAFRRNGEDGNFDQLMKLSEKS